MQQRRSTARWLEQRRMHSPAHCIDDCGDLACILLFHSPVFPFLLCYSIEVSNPGHASIVGPPHSLPCLLATPRRTPPHRAPADAVVVPPSAGALPGAALAPLDQRRRSHATQFLTFNEWMTSDNNMDLRLGGPVQKV
uniref:Uncharacterized protein n=1 Tax=Oryza barthii TaxID=65489 RepID=A0A0D3FRT1_9ORYZ